MHEQIGVPVLSTGRLAEDCGSVFYAVREMSGSYMCRLATNLTASDHIFYYSIGHTVRHTIAIVWQCLEWSVPPVVPCHCGPDHCGPVPLVVIGQKIDIILKKLKKP